MVNADIRLALLKSAKFKRWSPSRNAFGFGNDLAYTGKTFKNLAKHSDPANGRQSKSASRVHDAVANPSANPIEKHYTVAEVSGIWGVSEDLVRDLFRDESGVLRIRRPATKMKRGYSTLRIPESTLHRVYSELSNEKSNAQPLAPPHKKLSAS